jgi:hypothetical protein
MSRGSLEGKPDNARTRQHLAHFGSDRAARSNSALAETLTVHFATRAQGHDKHEPKRTPTRPLTLVSNINHRVPVDAQGNT